MCSKTDSETTYCSEVEELLKATSSAIKCCVPQISTQPVRRSQRILEKSKTKVVDLNDFFLCDISCLDKFNKRETKYSNKNSVTTKVSQDIFSTQDLREDQQFFCNESICEQVEKNYPLYANLKSQLNVPLDLSRKSKESLKETYESVLEKQLSKENTKEILNANVKLLSTQNIKFGDFNIKNAKHSKRGRPKNIGTNEESLQKNSKRYNKNVTNTAMCNGAPPLTASEILQEDSNNIVGKYIDKSIGLANTSISHTFKCDIKTSFKPANDDKTANCIQEKPPTSECAVTNELKRSKFNTNTTLDVNLKVYATNTLNTEDIILSKCSKIQDQIKNSKTCEYKILHKSPINEIIETNLKSRNKRIAIPKNNVSAKITKIDELQLTSPIDKTNNIVKTERKSNICKNSSPISINSTHFKSDNKLTHRKKIIKRKILTSKPKAIKKPIWPNTTLKLSDESIALSDNKIQNFKNVRILNETEKSLIEQNYRKTLFRVNSEEIYTKNKNWDRFRCKRKRSLSQNAAMLPIRQLKRSLPTSETLKQLVSFQNPLTPAQSVLDDQLVKSILPDDYPPHFKYQLPPEAAFNNLGLVQPTCVITPDDTPSVELLDSSSSSPSLPESLCELLKTNNIKDLLNINKVSYRLYEYHIEALALVLNLNQDYLRKILDRIINIPSSVLKNINKAVQEPLIMDQDLFTNTPDESLANEEVVFNSQSPKESK